MKLRLAAAALVLAAAALWGCGGGGDTTPSRIDCSSTEFVPNYVSDLDHLYAWSSFPITVAFVADSNLTSTRRATAIAGFNEWVSASGSIFHYNVINDVSSADLTVRFDPTTPDSVTQMTTSGATLIHADMALGLQDPENTAIQQPLADLQCSAAHEFGHTLGIGGHSQDPGDLMYFAHIIGQPCPLTTRDLNTAKSAYCGLFPTPPTARSPIVYTSYR